MKKFDKFNKDLSDRKNKDLEFFRSIDENCSLDDSILEMFDTAEEPYINSDGKIEMGSMKSRFEIPAMQGTLGPDIVDFDQGEWSEYAGPGLHDKFILEVPYLSNFTPMGSKDGKRMVFELTNEKLADHNYMIESKAYLDITLNNEDSITFFFDCYVKGISRVDDDPKEYTIFKDYFTQGITTLNGGIEILNTTVKRKIDLWNEEVKKWTDQELLKASPLVQSTMN